jgi:hypothetical protein
MLRFEVFKRDGFACVYCNRKPPTVLLECDHVIAVASGGPDDINNLVTACADCNRGKGARDLSAIPPTLEQIAEQMREREAQVLAFNAMVQAKQERLEREAWIIADLMIAAWQMEEGIFVVWLESLKRFADYLPLDELLDAARIAVSKFPHSTECDDGFRYFCGICWRKIRPPLDDEGAD